MLALKAQTHPIAASVATEPASVTIRSDARWFRRLAHASGWLRCVDAETGLDRGLGIRSSRAIVEISGEFIGRQPLQTSLRIALRPIAARRIPCRPGGFRLSTGVPASSADRLLVEGARMSRQTKSRFVSLMRKPCVAIIASGLREKEVRAGPRCVTFRDDNLVGRRNCACPAGVGRVACSPSSHAQTAQLR